MRMRPPAPGLYPKDVPPGGDILHGKFIPGGTAIGMNTASLCRSTAHFGVDAELFRPERFLVTEETRLHMERDLDLIFGYGKYMCVGKSVALMELGKVYFEVSIASSIL
jgi:cytochrome P450